MIEIVVAISLILEDFALAKNALVALLWTSSALGRRFLRRFDYLLERASIILFEDAEDLHWFDLLHEGEDWELDE